MQENHHSQLQKVQQTIINKIQVQDYMHILYLRSIQISLRYQNNLNTEIKQLPVGLNIVSPICTGQNSTCYLETRLNPQILQDILTDSINKTQYQNLRQRIHNQNCDNLLVHMKLFGEIQIAITVCMYNESKQMLENTLFGIGSNIQNLCKIANFNSDKVAVIIIADGIDKTHKSIVDWNEMLLKESGMFLSDDIPEQTIKQLLNPQSQNSAQFQEDNQFTNYNSVLFTFEQLQKRKSERFSVKHKEYMDILKLKQETQLKLKLRVTPKFDDLTQKMKPFVYKQSQKLYKQKNGYQFQAHELNTSIEKYSFDYFLSNELIGPQLIRSALTSIKQYCSSYLKSRQTLSHLSFYRTSRYFSKPTEKGQDQNQSFNNQQDNQKKMNIFFCAKYKNAQKLSSHNWFFNGFCRQLNPKYAILLDVGLKPGPQALYRMYVCLKNNQNVGGVCGYMGLKIQKAEFIETDFITSIMHYFVDVQRAQQMQYHFAHIIDKPFQSWFSFIHVLPGAFSGYNVKAIWKQDDNKLLRQYFKSINDKIDQIGEYNQTMEISQIILRIILPNFLLQFFFSHFLKSQQQLMYDQNVYLAQDRILCMGIHKNDFKLVFLPNAFAQVDPIKNLQDLLGQRKRWINGSFFAFSKVKNTLNQTDFTEDIGLKFQIVYLSLMNMLGYIAPSLFLFTIYIAMQTFKDAILVNILSQFINPNSQIYDGFVSTIIFIYIVMIGGLIFYSMNLTNKNTKFMSFVYKVSTALGIFSLIIFIILLIDLVNGIFSQSQFVLLNSQSSFLNTGRSVATNSLRYVILGIIGLYALPVLVCSIAFSKATILFQIILGVVSFIFYTPTYLSILNIYALCKMDDLSWGTKGLQTSQNKQNQQTLQNWKILKTIHVGKFIFYNVVTGGLLLHFGTDQNIKFWITLVIIGLIASTMTIKIIFCLLYYIKFLIFFQTDKLQKSFEEIQSQTFYKRFLKVKSYYEDSIKNNIVNQIQNIENSKKSIPITVNNILLNCASRYIQQKRKLQSERHSSYKKNFISASPVYKINFSASRNEQKKTISVWNSSFKIKDSQIQKSNQNISTRQEVEPISTVKIFLKAHEIKEQNSISVISFE